MNGYQLRNIKQAITRAIRDHDFKRAHARAEGFKTNKMIGAFDYWSWKIEQAEKKSK